MFELEIVVDDWDINATIELILPCNIKQEIDVSHSLYIIDWNSSISLGDYSDVEGLNEAVQAINDAVPSMTLEMLEEIFEASNVSSLIDDNFVQRLCSEDYMLEEVDISKVKLHNDSSITHEEVCAYYLSTEMMIPFAKNIDEKALKEMRSNYSNVNWLKVWDYYSSMGFSVILIEDKIYIFNWQNAEGGDER